MNEYIITDEKLQSQIEVNKATEFESLELFEFAVKIDHPVIQLIFSGSYSTLENITLFRQFIEENLLLLSELRDEKRRQETGEI